MFILAMYWLLSIILFQPWQPLVPGTLDPLPYPFTVGDPEINIWNAWLYFFMYSFGILGNLFTGGQVAFPFQWAYFWDNYLVSIYYFGFEMCIIVAIISMVMFLRKCDTNWSFRAFLFMMGMLILVSLTQYAHYLSPAELEPILGPIFVTAWVLIFSLAGLLLFKKALTDLFQKKSRGVFYFCFAFFVIAVSYTSSGLFNTIPSFYFDSLSDSVININFLAFVSNPIFLAAFFTFLFLEITYLTAYNYEVSKPALEREHIIEKQLKELEKLGEVSTDQLRAKAELHSISIRRFFSSEAFDFMRELIEKGVYDKESQAKMASFRDYQRLQAYLEDLYIKDPQAESSLTAKGSLPSASRLANASLKGTLYRVFIIFLLIIVCFSPILFFNVLSFIFPSLISSYLEIATLAAVIVIAIPLVLLFPTVGTIIQMRRMPALEEEEKKSEEKSKKQVEVERTGMA